MSTLVKKTFDPTSPHFYASIFTVALSILAAVNIQFNQPVEQLSDSLATTLTTQGVYAIVGIIFVSVLGPIYTAIQKKSIRLIWGSTSTWLYLAKALAAILVLIGIGIPEGSAEQLIAAIWAKDWAAVGAIAAVAILDPLIRWIKQKLSKPPALPGT